MQHTRGDLQDEIWNSTPSSEGAVERLYWRLDRIVMN